MKKREERKVLPNMRGEAERYFILLEFVLLALTMIYLLYLIFGTVKDVAGKATGIEQVILAPVFDRINFLLLVRISILFFVVFSIHFLLGLFYLHRITGPLVRIRSILNQIAGGTIPKTDVTLRKGDFPTDVAQALSRALKRIRQWQADPKA